MRPVSTTVFIPSKKDICLISLRCHTPIVATIVKANTTTPIRRKSERVLAEMPVQVAGSLGTTRDVSATGVFFEIDSSMAVGSEISFEIEMQTALGPMMMKCRGQIVRTEQQGARTGVAVKMIDSQLQAAQ